SRPRRIGMTSPKLTIRPFPPIDWCGSAAVLEQPLPRGQARHHEGRAHREVNVPRQRREVACLDGHILRQRAVAKRRESDAASRTRSLRRTWPGAAEIAGKPPAVASATPGVLRKKVSVISREIWS